MQPIKVEAMQAALTKKSKAVERAILRATMRAAILVQGKARVKIMKGPKSGAIYPRGKKKHQASAPGEPPANDTGNLQRSMSCVSKGLTDGVATVELQVAAPYAAALEFGNLSGTIKERPFLRPSVKESEKEIEAIAKQAVIEATNV